MFLGLIGVGCALPGGGPPPSAPALLSVVVNAGGNSADWNFDSALDTGSVPLFGDSWFSGPPVDPSSVSVSGSKMTTGLLGTVYQSESLVAGYTPGANPLRDASTLVSVAAITRYTVTNNSTQIAPNQTPTIFGAQFVTGTNGVRTANWESQGTPLRTGDKLCVTVFSRSGTAPTLSAPAGEGWVPMSDGTHTVAHSESGATLAGFQKDWGAGGGQVDSWTSAFTSTIAGQNYTLNAWIVRGAAAGNAAQVAMQATLQTASATVTPPFAASAPPATSITQYIYFTLDDNTLNNPSRGTLAAGATGNNTQANGCQGMAYEAGVDSSVNRTTVNESTNGNDQFICATVVYNGTPAPRSNTYTLRHFATQALTRERVNSDGWVATIHTDEHARSGYFYRYILCTNGPTQTLTLRCDRAAAPTSGSLRDVHESDWSSYDTFTTGTISIVGTATWGDSHFGIAICTSKGGKLQVWGFGHGTEAEMLFWQGTAPGDIHMAGWVTWATVTGVSYLTYPAAWNTGDGTSGVLFRAGTAGQNAQIVAWEQANEADDWATHVGHDYWTPIPGGLSSVLGTNVALIDHSAHTSSPYFGRPVYDPAREMLHIQWGYYGGSGLQNYHHVMHAQWHRTGAATYAAQSADGTAQTMPITDLTAACVVDTLPVNNGYDVQGGLCYDPATGYPIVPYIKATSASAGTGTDAWVAIYQGAGGWNKVKAFQANATDNLVSIAYNYESIRTPECCIHKGQLLVWITSDDKLTVSGEPGLYMAACTNWTAGSPTFGSAACFSNQPFAGANPRYDANALRNGKLSLGAVRCNNPDTHYTLYLPTVSNASRMTIDG